MGVSRPTSGARRPTQTGLNPVAVTYLQVGDASSSVAATGGTAFVVSSVGDTITVAWTSGGNSIATPLVMARLGFVAPGGRTWGNGRIATWVQVEDIAGVTANDDLLIGLALGNGLDTTAGAYRAMNSWLKLGPQSQTVGKGEDASTINAIAGSFGASLTSQTDVDRMRLDPAFGDDGTKFRHQTSMHSTAAGWINSAAQNPQNTTSISMGADTPMVLQLMLGQFGTSGNATGSVSFKLAWPMS